MNKKLRSQHFGVLCSRSQPVEPEEEMFDRQDRNAAKACRILFDHTRGQMPQPYIIHSTSLPLNETADPA